MMAKLFVLDRKYDLIFVLLNFRVFSTSTYHNEYMKLYKNLKLKIF